ncbi:60S ribosomal export protein NMD3 [Geodia barretti]|uniref:60S ribosomal export protein NMD3 n=1 Tax=Geodia barretti TaxID=519541 RepID=A0AA35WK27_GEOBA|nr:60S ribosomal export protein NMD3 [Geodia barretti]
MDLSVERSCNYYSVKAHQSDLLLVARSSLGPLVRYLQPPASWVSCTLESRELLAVCLKRLKGLSKIHLVDAGFVWTEPHSKRVKVKLTIQKEWAGLLLQQVFCGEYVVHHQMCHECPINAGRPRILGRQQAKSDRGFHGQLFGSERAKYITARDSAVIDVSTFGPNWLSP